jgi:hypothetical protein
MNENDQEDRRKRQHTNQNTSASTQQQQQKKMSYIQMARLGYQELVNAIIRPPRADYKVCRFYGVLTCDPIRLPNGTVVRKSNVLTLLNLFWHGIILDGSVGPSCLYFLWKTVHQN